MSFTETIAKRRRHFLLSTLTQAPPYFQASNRVLHSAAVSDFEYPPSLDQVNSDIQWLAEQGLVTVETMQDGKTVRAKLTARGDDAAHGRAIVPGVEPPAPLEA